MHHGNGAMVLALTAIISFIKTKISVNFCDRGSGKGSWWHVNRSFLCQEWSQRKLGVFLTQAADTHGLCLVGEGLDESLLYSRSSTRIVVRPAPDGLCEQGP